MKNIFITALILLPIVFLACTAKPQDTSGRVIDHYTCPMHHQIHADKPGKCPICGMTLVPVYKDSALAEKNQAKDEALPEEKQTGAVTTPKLKGVTIPVPQQNAIGIKTATVTKMPSVKTIHAFGVVAYDPGLAVAQTEYLNAARAGGDLKNAARQRLRLLGMSEIEIDALAKSGKSSSNLYLPGNTSALWVYATLYENDFRLVKAGLAADIFLSGENVAVSKGIVRSVDPVFNADTRTVRARIEVDDPQKVLRPDLFVNVGIKIDLGDQLVIPRSTYIDTGERKIAYVVSADTYFEGREIVTGDVVGDNIIVTSGLAEGEHVAAGALFLVDSEAELRGK